MQQPIIADNKPAKIALEKDKKYYFCVCGKSNKQPFCDGSHQGSEFTPMAFVCDESGRYFVRMKSYISVPLTLDLPPASPPLPNVY